jgi:hypothetical protein
VGESEDEEDEEAEEIYQANVDSILRDVVHCVDALQDVMSDPASSETFALINMFVVAMSTPIRELLYLHDGDVMDTLRSLDSVRARLLDLRPRAVAPGPAFWISPDCIDSIWNIVISIVNAGMESESGGTESQGDGEEEEEEEEEEEAPPVTVPPPPPAAAMASGVHVHVVTP